MLQKTLSHAAGWLSQTKVSWLKNLLIWLFIKVYKPKMTEAVGESPKDYLNFHSFFTRRLKDGARPIVKDKKGRIISPVDGSLFSHGKIKEGIVSPLLYSVGDSVGDSASRQDIRKQYIGGGNKIHDIKNRSYTIAQLLGMEADYVGAEYRQEILPRLSDASYSIIYLAPEDYHRVHCPCDGKLILTNFIPGSLFSVNQASAIKRPSLHAYNQRLAFIMETPYGLLALVMVAALIVSSIGTSWGKVHRAVDDAFQDTSRRDFEMGDELGYFSLGSSVVLLWERDDLTPMMADKTKIRMGESLIEL